MIYRLIILNGERKGEQLTVPQEPVTLGRGDSCDIRLNDIEVAASHAAVEHRPEGLFIRDLGSMSRILVNHHEVREAQLRHGDVIELGRTRLLVQVVVEAEVHDPGLLPRSRKRQIAGAVVIVALAAAAAVVPLVRLWRALQSGESSAVVAVAPRPAEPETNAAPAPAPVPSAEAPVPGPAAAPQAPPTAATAEVAIALPPELAAPAASNPVVTAPAPEIPPATAPLAPVPETHPAAAAPGADVEAVRTAATAMLVARVEELMGDARRFAKNNDFIAADRLLLSAAKIMPDYAAAYAERARLFEKQGMLDPAIEQWREVLRRGEGSGLAAEAEAEMSELVRAKTQVAPDYGGRIRVVDGEQNRFPETAEFSEMRTVQVRLVAANPDQPPDADAVQVEVRFYDRDGATGAVAPTRAAVPLKRLIVAGAWRAGEEKTVTATYAVPARRGSTPARTEQYYGYVIRVYYYGALQDVYARPKDLGDSGVGDTRRPESTPGKPGGAAGKDPS